MLSNKITRARQVVRRILTDSAVVWRCVDSSVDPRGERSRVWEVYGEVACLCQDQAAIESGTAGRSAREEFAMVFKCPYGSGLHEGDLVEMTSGALNGRKFVVGAVQAQSWAVVDLHGANPYSATGDEFRED